MTDEVLGTFFTTQGLQDLQVPMDENRNVDHVAFDEGEMGAVRNNIHQEIMMAKKWEMPLVISIWS